MVGVVLSSNLAHAQTKEVQYGITPAKPVKYYQWRCTAWRAANASVACSGCQPSVCTHWVKEILTPAEVQQVIRNKKK
jgi:hypothetical protein